ncbi:MAG: acylphosphatase, partial [Candidatus Acidiferrales bacterium]
MQVRKEIRVSGIVQGVGFRPYVFRLATELDLSGMVRNTPVGVTIEIQGAAERVDNFVLRLPEEAPALASITEVAVREVPCNGGHGFEILASRTGDRVRTLISPDVEVCGDCLRELFDPKNRRYLYPFINCTNCGPRFTIVRDIPYDRARTSMAKFPMCPECRAEYENVLDRRFHAEATACWKCGPRLELWDPLSYSPDVRDPIREAAQRLQAGQVVAVKGLGGFHLAADATNPAAVELLRRRKHRVEKPFAMMVPDLESAEKICEVDDA